MTRPTKTRLRDVLIECGGVVAAVAEHFQVQRQTVYNWIDAHGLGDELEAARDRLFRVAEDNILQAVQAGDLDMSRFVVQHMPSSRRRWGGRLDVATADVSALSLSADIQQLMREQGISAADVLREFEALMRVENGAVGALTSGASVADGEPVRRKRGRPRKGT